MPMHDWRRVEPNIYRDFHGEWMIAVKHALNRGVLPADHYALTEQSVVGVVADVLTLRRPGRTPADPVSGAAPAVGVVDRAARRASRLTRRVVVRHTSNHRVVAVIELVSPGNKDSARDLRAFVEKAAGLLNDGVHLLVIDPFAPGPRDPAGLHPLIWKRAVPSRRRPPPTGCTAAEPLAVVGYATSTADVTAVVQTFPAAGPVPDGPLFLTADGCVMVPLEAAYRAAFDEVPAVWRAELGG